MLHEWLGFALELLELLFSWPVVILALVFLFRRRIEQVLAKLSKRLSSFSVGGVKAEFRTDDKISAALIELAFARARSSPVVDSEETVDDDTEVVDDSSSTETIEIEAAEEPVLIDETTLTEFDQELERLGGRG